MTNAATGNPLIPSHPTVQQQRTSAQTATPSNGSQPAQTPPEIDWAAMMLGDEPSQPAPAAQAPAAQAPAGSQPAPEGLTPEQKEAIARANMEAPPAAPPTPATMTQEQAVAAATQHLLDTTYKLTEEQQKQLISEPDKVIPQLAAQMHVTIARQLGEYMEQYLQNIVPQMALSTMQRQMGAFRAEQAFFGQYPALARPEFRNVVLQSLKLAKAYAPQATREQVMKDAAELAAFKLKVNLNPPQAPQAPQGRQPHTPATAPAPAATPFMPAMPGGAPATNVQGQPTENVFEALAMDPNW